MHLTSPLPSPAQTVAGQLQWVTKGDSVISKVEATDVDTVTVTVPDSEDHKPKWMADMAHETLRPVIDGVKMLYVDQHGNAGERQGFSGDETIDLITGLPGVRDYANVLWDVNKDGTVADDEGAHVVQVASRAAEAKVSQLLPSSIDSEPVIYTTGEI